MRVNKRLLNRKSGVGVPVSGRRTNACSYLVRYAHVASRASRAMLNKERPTCAPEIGQGANRV